MPGRCKAIPYHQQNEYAETHGKVDERHQYRCGRNDEPRKINFADEIRARHQAVRCFRERGRKKRPGQHPREYHQRIGRRAFCWKFRDAPEDDSEHRHRENGSDDGPQSTDDSLLVADGHVAPREHLKQLAIAPKITPIILLRAAGLENNFHLARGRGLRQVMTRQSPRGCLAR